MTGVPSGSEPALQPLVSVAAPVPEQCAAWPMYVLVASLKMKFAVHCAPPVNVCTPGWTGPVAAGGGRCRAAQSRREYCDTCPDDPSSHWCLHYGSLSRAPA